MAKKRITELATETTLKDGQYVAIDHTTDGTKKYDIGSELTDLKEDIGEWYYNTTMTSRYPYIIVNKTYTKVYFKLLTPTENVSLVTIFGVSGGTHTELYRDTRLEFVASIDPTGYDSLKYVINLPASATVTFSAIIHGFDGSTLSQYVYDHDLAISDLFVPTIQKSGTEYEKFYLTNIASGGIKAINNTAFTLTAYAVEKDKTYYLYGEQVKLGNSLVLAAFGTSAVVDGNSYIEAIISATTTPTDYVKRYVPKQNGYIYVARFGTANGVLNVYDTAYISDAFEKNFGKRKAIKIQCFGDSITDNTWGDKLTWVDLISANLSEFDVTVVNDAVAGSGITGHGKATGTTTQHQDDEYNYVYDLVTDGETLQTDADYIVILAGTNNWASSTALGDMSSTGYTTIYGALKGILGYISEHSTATVFVCTIPQRYNTADESKSTNAYGEPLDNNNVSLADYCEPFRKLSAFYGMPCVHLNEALGWNRINIDSFTIDGLHPNEVGDKMLAGFICNAIRSHNCGEAIS